MGAEVFNFRFLPNHKCGLKPHHPKTSQGFTKSETLTT